jgi:hypothetical protein
VGGFLGARGSPFPAGFGIGLGLRLGLSGLGASATVLRGFGVVCDLVFIPRRQSALLCARGLGFTRGLELEEWRSQMREDRERERRTGWGDDDLTAELSTSRGP